VKLEVKHRSEKKERTKKKSALTSEELAIPTEPGKRGKRHSATPPQNKACSPHSNRTHSKKKVDNPFGPSRGGKNKSVASLHGTALLMLTSCKWPRQSGIRGNGRKWRKKHRTARRKKENTLARGQPKRGGKRLVHSLSDLRLVMPTAS